MQKFLSDTCNEYSLSDKDILKTFCNNVKILSYDELVKYNNLDELLYPHKAVIILYQLNNAYTGHWILLFEHPKDPQYIEYFDPTGLVPDQLLKDKKTYKQQEHILSKLLLSKIKEGFNIVVNTFPYQKIRTGINTCGRWCLIRYRLRYLKLPEFKKVFEKPKYELSRDSLICAMTFLL